MDLRPSPMPAAPAPSPPRDWWIALGLLLAATAPGLLLERGLGVTGQAMLYVLAVTLGSGFLGWIPSLACAVAAVGLLNYLFIQPRYSLAVDTPENVLALAAMTAVALTISRLAGGWRREAEVARLNESRARQLQALATGLASAATPSEVRTLTEGCLRQAFAGPAVVALLPCPGEQDAGPGALAPHLRDGIAACVREDATLGPGTGRWPGLDAWFIPLRTQARVAGAACIGNVRAADHEGREHAQAICTLAGQALWRLQLASAVQDAQARSRLHAAQNTFLAAISHDLRTPLAAIVGAASALRVQGERLPAAQRDQLLCSIEGEAARLAALTENTLQLVRLGNVELATDWQAMEEIVGAVLARLRQQDPGHRIHAEVPPGLPLVQADAVLLAQLLENLLDNALKYSAGQVDLAITQEPQALRIAVQDRGAGIPAGEEEAIFEPFHRGDRSPERGAGLGLALCRAIARAHGGELAVQARAGGGSSFVLTLPLARLQPVPAP